MEEHLSGRDLHSIYSDVFDTARKWYNLGLALGLLPDELDKISSAHRDEPDACLREMLKLWLSKLFPRPTRKALIGALRQRTVGYQQLACDLEMNYQPVNQIRHHDVSAKSSTESALPVKHPSTSTEVPELQQMVEMDGIKRQLAERDTKLKAEIDQNAALQAELDDLIRQLQIKNADVKALSQLASTHGKEKEQLALAKEAERLKRELLVMQQTRTNEGRTKQAEIDQLTAEIDDLKGQLRIRNTQVSFDELQEVSERSLWILSREDLPKEEQRMRELTSENEIMMSKNEELMKQLTKLDTKNYSARKSKQKEQITILERELQAKRKELESVKTDTQSQLAVFRKEQAKKDVDIKLLRDENTAFKTEIDDLKGHLQIKQVEKKQLAKEVERLNGQLLKMEQSRRDDTKTKQVEINRLTAEIDDLKKQLQIKNTQVKELASTRGEEKEQLAKEAESLKGELLAELVKCQQALQTSKRENSKLEKIVHQLRAQLKMAGLKERTCPVCNVIFPQLTSQRDFESHVQGHGVK